MQDAHNKEKAMLCEQILALEQRAESASEKADEYKRRLDEILAALHELGRENQTMQVL